MFESLNEIHLCIEGDDLTQLLNESGGHRIQRIPPTEKKGRVHTSTVTVAVMETQDKVLLEIKDSDLKVEWYSGSGSGGQHRNKHQNSCRLTHIPTNTTVTSQCRSRQNSYDNARTELVTRLQKETNYKIDMEQSTKRKELVGTGMRGDKIRTYRFQDDVVTDHNTGKKASTKDVMSGKLELLWD